MPPPTAAMDRSSGQGSPVAVPVVSGQNIISPSVAIFSLFAKLKGSSIGTDCSEGLNLR